MELPVSLLLGYKKNTDVNFTINDIELLNNDAFANATTWFGSCNTGTSYNGGNSFAQKWSNKTGGISTAVVDGQTTYTHINVVENLNVWQRIEKNLRGVQRRLINYSADGSYNYPIAADGIQWNDFTPEFKYRVESKRED